MPQEENKKELDRKFTKLGTWEEFATLWGTVGTEDEAASLLHTGTKVPYQNSYEPAAEVEKRVNFYLLWSNHENETVRATAQQLLIRHWLRQARMTTEYARVHQALLKFLIKIGEPLALAIKESYFPIDSSNERRFALLKPPHPRFVAEYLAKIYKVWFSSYQQEKDYLAFRVFTEDFAIAACSWGVPYMFAESGQGKSTIPVIEQFLKKRGYDPGKVFMTLSGYGEPLADLSFPGAQDKVKERAACALLKMRYWFGGGVQETYTPRLRLRSLE